MRLSSPEFHDGERIPEQYTCEGDNISPPLVIEDIPDRAVSLALIVDDPDAPRGTFDHWLIWNLPSSLTTLPQAIPPQDLVEGLGPAAQGANHYGRIGYGGPCPPGGKPHRYRFHLYALDSTLHLSPGVERGRLEGALDGHVLDEAELTGLFGR